MMVYGSLFSLLGFGASAAASSAAVASQPGAQVPDVTNHQAIQITHPGTDREALEVSAEAVLPDEGDDDFYMAPTRRFPLRLIPGKGRQVPALGDDVISLRRQRPVIVGKPATAEDALAGRRAFGHAQALERAGQYSVGGAVDGVGMLWQRVAEQGADRYLANPVAAGILGPFIAWGKSLAEKMSQTNLRSVEENLAALGDSWMGAGNLIKVAVGTGAFLYYSVLRKRYPNEGIIRKATEGNMGRSFLYLGSKALYGTGGLVGASGHFALGISTMVFAEVAVLALAAASIWGNLDVIVEGFGMRNLGKRLRIVRSGLDALERRGWLKPAAAQDVILSDHDRIARANDAANTLGTNLAKGTWSVATLGALLYFTLPERIQDVIPFFKQVPHPETTQDFFKIAMKVSWDMAPWLIAAGAIAMVTPNLIGSFLEMRKLIGIQIQHDRETKSAQLDGLSHSRTDVVLRKIYDGTGLLQSVLLGFGGGFTASFWTQPLGSAFNVVGNLVRYGHNRFGNWLSRRQ